MTRPVDDIRVARAGAFDLAILAALHRAAFIDPASAETAETWDEPFLASLLAGSGVEGWIASLDGDPSGFALSRAAAGEAEILTIGVRPDRRGRGVGAALLARLIDACRTAGASVLFLEVASDNAAAVALYRRAGFEEVGIRKGYYRRRKGSVDAVVMRLDLA